MPRLDARLEALLDLGEGDRLEELRNLTERERKELRYLWPLWARRSQLPPPGDWRCWLICAGRGFGKTRAGAEWVRDTVRHNPDARIALVGASLGEVRAVMVEGESGLLDVCPPEFPAVFEPSLRRVTWGNGAQAFLYSAAEPESLRGPQHHAAWCDEIGKWDDAGERAMRAWDNLQLGLRLGENPRVLATTTPRGTPLMRKLVAEEAVGTVAVTRGTMKDNAANLPTAFVTAMLKAYGRTHLGRQELHGELIADAEGALWTRAMLDTAQAPRPEAALCRVVVAVDPPASARGDECGIVVAALDENGLLRVRADASIARPSPERWARAVAEAAAEYRADRVVAEANQGGAMVASVLRAASIDLPVKLVHARLGKSARAEPIAALYEAGRVHHEGLFARLEDQLCGLMAGGTYEGPGRSPDRADALVWALHELTASPPAKPLVRCL